MIQLKRPNLQVIAFGKDMNAQPDELTESQLKAMQSLEEVSQVHLVTFEASARS